MNTANDLLMTIQRDGAARFASTSLATNHSAVTKRVRMHRTASAATGIAAGAGLIGSGGWWFASHGAGVGPAGVGPAGGSPTATNSPSAPADASLTGVGTHDVCLERYPAAADPTAEFASGALPTEALCVVPGLDGVVMRADAALALEATIAAARLHDIAEPVVESGYMSLAEQSAAAADAGEETPGPELAALGTGLTVNLAEMDAATFDAFVEVAEGFGWRRADLATRRQLTYVRGTSLPEPGLLTIVEGRTIDFAAVKLAELYGVTEQAAADTLALAVAELAPEAATPEGWVSPSTFDLTEAPTVTDAARLLVSRRIDELTALGAPRDDWQRLVTVASLVEEESRRPEDMPLISSVIANRLDAGLRLELDSSIVYITGREDIFATASDRAVDSPYNTYLYQGLPPGAITAPSLGALSAAFEPASTDYLFFVTVNLETGDTAYAATLAEHQANVARLQAWLDTQP